MATIVYVAFAIWQLLLGLGLIFEQAKVYGKSSNPQAKRVAQLAGAAWLGYAYLGLLAGMHIEQTFARHVMWVEVIFNALFSVAVGPARLTAANSREPVLAVVNTGIVALVAVVLLLC
mmetsp:Transcript_15810/g.42373  ORF Transcript_15810/g.42373 Transcript_15810/m.42373 type:complete len:118 (-) Transcript_15810:349-702(-)